MRVAQQDIGEARSSAGMGGAGGVDGEWDLITAVRGVMTASALRRSL